MEETLKIYWNLKGQNLQIYDFNIKNVYIDKLDDLVNYTYNCTIKMKSVDLKWRAYIDSSKEYKLCIIYIFSKDPWVIPLKDKKGITATNVFKTLRWM